MCQSSSNAIQDTTGLFCHVGALLVHGLLVQQDPKALLSTAAFQTACLQCVLMPGFIPLQMQVLLKLMQFLFIQFSANLLRVQSTPLSRSLMKTLDTIGSSTEPISDLSLTRLCFTDHNPLHPLIQPVFNYPQCPPYLTCPLSPIMILWKRASKALLAINNIHCSLPIHQANLLTVEGNKVTSNKYNFPFINPCR